PAQRHVDFHVGETQRLALLHCLQLLDLGAIGLEGVGVGQHQAGTLGEGRLGPALEGGTGMLDGGVEILLPGHGDFVKGLCSSWIDGVPRLRRWYELAIDDVSFVGLQPGGGREGSGLASTETWTTYIY